MEHLLHLSTVMSLALDSKFSLDDKYLWLVLTAVVVVVLLYCLDHVRRSYFYWSSRGVPGPRGLWSLLSFRQPMAELYGDYARRYGKIFGLVQLGRPILFVTDPVVIKRILVQDFHIFRNRTRSRVQSKYLQRNLINIADEDWKRVRSLLTPTFTSNKLRHMEPLMLGCVDDLVEAFEKVATSPQPVVWLNEKMGNFTMDVIARCAFATATNANKTADDSKPNVFIENARRFLTFSFWKFLLLLLIPQRLFDLLWSLKVPGVYNRATVFFANASKHIIRQRQRDRQAKGKQHFEDMLELMLNVEHNGDSFHRVNQADWIEQQHYVGKITRLDHLLGKIYDFFYLLYPAKEELAKERETLANFSGTKYLSEDEMIAQTIIFFIAG